MFVEGLIYDSESFTIFENHAYSHYKNLGEFFITKVDCNME